ncbi:hypothetical protein [Microbacterium sp. NPDC056052]|uniref:hypothetical protein n=1 Tax=Microbacterium sp. NPDC056052 TaxID=3345695 RepID=UPI0035DA63FA
MSRNNWGAGVLRKATYAAGAMSLAVAGILITVPGASAEDAPCTPTPASDEQVLVTPAVPATPGTPAVTHTEYQRWSWKGGPDGPAPSDIPPSEGWQENTEAYFPGHSDDPLNTIFQAGTPGNADYFYWATEEVTDTPEVPGTPEIPAVYTTMHHDAVTCSVVTPPVVTPPVVTPPVVAPETHIVPTTVQTDGDQTAVTVLAAGLGVLAAGALTGAGLLIRSRRG